MLCRVCWQLAHYTCVPLPWLGFNLNAFTPLMRALLMILTLLVTASPRSPHLLPTAHTDPVESCFFFMYRMHCCCRGDSAALEPNHTKHSNIGFFQWHECSWQNSNGSTVRSAVTEIFWNVTGLVTESTRVSTIQLYCPEVCSFYQLNTKKTFLNLSLEMPKTWTKLCQEKKQTFCGSQIEN